MTYVDIINVFELIWWPTAGIAVAVRSRNAIGRWKHLGWFAAFWLILFGLSDGVELYTKTWWSPWWLLVWKATCINVLVACLIIRFRWTRTP